MEFIKGKWYRNSEWRDNAYCKADGSKIHDRVYFTECIDNDKHTYKLDWWQNEYGFIEEVPIEKIQQWLPDGHEDKINSIEKWSVGSYVVYIINYGGYPKGTVDEIIGNGRDCISGELKFDNGNISCNLVKDIECKWFATKEEAEVFAKSLIPIPELQPKEESKSLVGRYVKTKDDEYLLLTKSQDNGGYYVNNSSRFIDLHYVGKPDDLKNHYQLMPKGFNPDSIAPKVVSKQLTIDDLVEGEIYVERYSSWDYEYILKYKSLKAIVIEDSQHHSFISNRGCDIGNSKSVIRLATPQEKKHLNVCIKQNKFINQDQLDLYDDVTFELNTVMKESKTKFKIGDKVRIINRSKSNTTGNTPECNKPNGFVGSVGYVSNWNEFHYQITEFPNGVGRYYGMLDIEGNNSSTFIDSDLELVTEEEYQVGDWVTIKDSDNLENGCQGCPKGTFIVVENVDDKYVSGLLTIDVNTFIVKTCDSPFKYWRISNKGVTKALPHEIPTQQENDAIQPKEMSREELIEEAKRRYPIGTIYKSEPSFYPSTCNGEFIVNKYGVYCLNNSGWIYYQDKWAEVISVPSTLHMHLYNPQTGYCDCGKKYFYKEYPVTPEECTPTPISKTPDKQVRLSNINEETKIKIKFKQSIKI